MWLTVILKSFSMLPIVLAADTRQWNFSVLGTLFWMKFREFFAKLLILEKMFIRKVIDLHKIMREGFKYIFCKTVTFWENLIFHKKRVKNFSYSPFKLIIWSISLKILVWQWSHVQMSYSLGFNEDISHSPLDSKSHTFWLLTVESNTFKEIW